MSKAMDALEVLQGYGDVAGQGMASVLGITQAIALLRDYITTTEAADVKGVRDIIPEMENALDTALHFKANDTHNDTIQAYEAWREKTLSMVNWSLCLLAENQRQLGRDESAARIKELEEALKPFSDEADRRPFLGVDACRANIAGNIGGSALTNLDLINARAVLSGARKVGA